MFTFMLLPDTEKFLNMVDHSRGEVFLNLPDGERCGLKQDSRARQLIRVFTPGRDGLKITLSDPKDAPDFFRYMKEAVL